MNTWIILILLFNGDMVSIPIEGRGTKTQCQEFAIELLKPHLENIKRIACVPVVGAV
jgi:hypothetical protein